MFDARSTVPCNVILDKKDAGVDFSGCETHLHESMQSKSTTALSITKYEIAGKARQCADADDQIILCCNAMAGSRSIGRLMTYIENRQDPGAAVGF